MNENIEKNSVSEKLIFEQSKKGKRGYSLSKLDVPEISPAKILPKHLVRSEPARLPEVSEPEIVRHYVNLSKKNYSVDTGFYPLGSCTMKYNPKINEKMSSLAGFSLLHPLVPEEQCQGALRLMFELEKMLCSISGMGRATLQPSAGAQGELCGTLIMRAYFKDRGEERKEIIIPDSAHGTNPASAALAGMTVKTVKSCARGELDLDTLKQAVNKNTAALMITNPNTLGLFESKVLEIASVMHENGSLLYLDGANLNAMLGLMKPGDMGFDIVHFNLHKSFSTPHGCGGPGAGPVGVRKGLEKYLPVPLVGLDGERYYFDYNVPKTIGSFHAFYGNFLVLVRAYTYLLTVGNSGLREISENAILNANYIMHSLKKYYDIPYDRDCMHEFVLSGIRQKKKEVRVLDIAKRLMDYGFHPPTIYFPLIVSESMMIEPTETESLETMDKFIEAMKAIAIESENAPEKVRHAPYTLSISRLDEVKAAKELDINYFSRKQ